MPIKYIGSKRRLVGDIMRVVRASGATTALDGFTGTTRVAQAMKQDGIYVTASDMASYSKMFADCYIATDADAIDEADVRQAIDRLMALPGKDGYFTETFCRKSRFVQPKNGMRIDAIRDAIESDYAGTPLYPILLTSLIEAADRVDSTTGVQMAYLKRWSPRSYNDLEMRVPNLLRGTGASIQGDIFNVLRDIPYQGLIYFDPPYNQHNYFGNYHIWETLVRWDHPDFYGVACKRSDVRDRSMKSVFNSKRTAPDAIRRMIAMAHDKCDCLVLSYNDESWISSQDMTQAVSDSGFESVLQLAFDYERYVGARIGIYSTDGTKVGHVDHTKNHEYMFVGADKATASRIAKATSDAIVTRI
jgi:adenine-specific DNA-methyltransferase